MALCALLTYEMLKPSEDNPMAVYPSAGIVIARFACGTILHMMLQGELTNGLNSMKFTLNHYYRFDNPWVAYLAGFLQSVSIFVIEIVNFLVILTSASYLEVVMNFMALAVISEFDDAFFESLGSDENKDIIENPAYEDLYKITRTTSRNCPETVGNLLEDDTIPEEMENAPLYMKQSFMARGPIRMALRGIYKVFRVFQITIWFYFLPFLALLGSFLVPFYINRNSVSV